MNTWSGIYKRDFIERFHIRHNTTPGASFQDTGFWFQTFVLAERIYFLDNPFYMYRVDNPNSSVNDKNKIYLINSEHNFIKNFIEQTSERKEKYTKIHNYKKFCNYLWNYKRIDAQFKKDFLKVFSEEFKQSVENDEIDSNIFSKKELKILKLIVNNPEEFHQFPIGELSFLECIFSVKNSIDKLYKIITIFGFKFKIKRRVNAEG